MVVAANDVSNLHVDIVDDDAKIIRRRAVRASDDEIVQFAIVENAIALDQVADYGRALGWRAEPNDIGFVSRQRWDHGFGRTTRAVVGGFAFLFLCQLSLGIQLRWCTGTRI